MANSFSKECAEALKLLSRSKNVLIYGPPGTGKSRLLAEVAHAFETGVLNAAGSTIPVHNPTAAVPIPPTPMVAEPSPFYAAPSKRNRKVFRCVFHQNSKYRDFVSGISPTINKTVGSADFTVIGGTLYRASEHAKTPDGASLLIIDEINRGPAVQVFGGAIVAIEHDKRLAPDGSKRTETQFFEITEPGSGDIIEYALPDDLYILAAMNQADASVEPLDVAFLRRWEPLRLEPNAAVLRAHYGIAESPNSTLPAAPSEAADVFEASVRAWQEVNKQISLGRSPEFQIGHGVLMPTQPPASLSIEEALELVCVGWAKIKAHVEEVFFGDLRGIASALNALDGPAYNPFSLEEVMFADDIRYRLEGPQNLTPDVLYSALRAFARE